MKTKIMSYNVKLSGNEFGIIFYYIIILYVFLVLKIIIYIFLNYRHNN